MPVEPETQASTPHVLDGFPAVAVRFVLALERNRELIASDHGLSASELRAMFYVGEFLSVTPKRLADHLEMTTGAITAISGRLVDIELLHRVAHPNDRRSIYLQLTPRGDALMRQIHDEFRAMIAASTVDLSPGQLDQFQHALELVSERISGHVGL